MLGAGRNTFTASKQAKDILEKVAESLSKPTIKKCVHDINTEDSQQVPGNTQEGEGWIREKEL